MKLGLLSVAFAGAGAVRAQTVAPCVARCATTTMVPSGCVAYVPPNHPCHRTDLMWD